MPPLSKASPRLRKRKQRRARSHGLKASVFLLTALCAISLALFALYSHVSERVLYEGTLARSMAGQGGHQPAVRFRQLYVGWSRVSLLDLSMDSPGVRVEVVAADARRRRSGCSDGVARTIADWCRTTGALGGIN